MRVAQLTGYPLVCSATNHPGQRGGQFSSIEVAQQKSLSSTIAFKSACVREICSLREVEARVARSNRGESWDGVRGDKQQRHRDGFYSVCVRVCRVRWLHCEKHKPHVSQRKGFSPVCVRVCEVRLDFLLVR